ncbi:hypothetical protein EV421DRAFT_1905517 [Armillaria borealis]|uniref:Uncharacterized protein n=1 Tax=Armillaria borealis TaxID=47425 RepID=A0AA39JCR5_9AGAR|nr:hypothetical protein EV421DRAFT_1905517 [Armillaria borealis]
MSAVLSATTKSATVAAVYIPPINKVPVEILTKFFVATSEEHDFKVRVGKRSDAAFAYGDSASHRPPPPSLLTLLRDRCPRLVSFKVDVTEPDSLHVLHMNACEFSNGLRHAVFTGLGAGTILRMPFDTLYDLTDEMSMTVDANTATIFLPALTSFTTCNRVLMMALALPVVEGVFIKRGLLHDTEEDGPLDRLSILPHLLMLLQNSQCQHTLQDMELHDISLTSELTAILQQAPNLDTLMFEMTEWTSTDNDVLISLIGGLRIRSEEEDAEYTLLPSLSLLSISIEGTSIPTSLSFIGEGLVETLESRIPKEPPPNFPCAYGSRIHITVLPLENIILQIRFETDAIAKLMDRNFRVSNAFTFTCDRELIAVIAECPDQIKCIPKSRISLSIPVCSSPTSELHSRPSMMPSNKTSSIPLTSSSGSPPENQPVACNDMARSPVMNIPAELIARIARATKDAIEEPLKVGDTTESPYTMAQVCRSWWDIVKDGCPDVWANFSVHIPPAGTVGSKAWDHLVKTALQWSGTRPLVFEFVAAEDVAISLCGATAFRYLLEEGYRWKSPVLNLSPQLLQMLDVLHFDCPVILSSSVTMLQTDTNRLDTLPTFAYAENARSLSFTGLDSKTQIYLPSLNLVWFTDIRTQIRSTVHDTLLVSLQVATRLSKVEMLYTHIMDMSPGLLPQVSWSLVTYFRATHRRTLGAVVLPSLQALVVELGRISWSDLHGADLHTDTMPTICSLIDRSRCDVSLERVELSNVPLTNHLVAMARVTHNLKSLQLVHVFWKK